MSQTQAIVTSLKQELKAQGKTYAQVAKVLGLSEASVKRLFSTANLSLQRLDKLCDMLGISVAELVARTQAREALSQLNEAQEQQLVDEPKLLLVAVCALNRWQFHEILATYHLSGAECIQLLAKLDRLRLIELLPNNRIKLLVDRGFRWLPGGPIQRYFRQQIQQDYFASSFDGPGEIMLFQNAMLSPSANAIMQRKLEALAREFNQLAEEDKNLPLSERYGSSIMLALRPWEVQSFAQLRRSGTEKHYPAEGA
ncbi:MAG: helix-turn-helix transcriptional regulator [Cellvibrionaceae bacterium]|nr:helix-turn-helix transcriptional regulator [Cellvibrionaceae bacterium]MCV6625416.1 helix-turn-helix transcriptional regulator [Cellvibrionaceae bacterium]